jgi:hypothetical protein
MDPLFQLLLKHGGGGDAITTGAFIDIDSRESGMDPTAGDRKAVRLKPSPCKHLLTAKHCTGEFSRIRYLLTAQIIPSR